MEQPSPLEQAARDAERRDVLAFLRAEQAKQETAAEDFARRSEWDAAGRCVVRRSILETAIAYIERGDHIGAAERSAAP